jgi:hypothetical protein
LVPWISSSYAHSAPGFEEYSEALPLAEANKAVVLVHDVVDKALLDDVLLGQMKHLHEALPTMKEADPDQVELMGNTIKGKGIKLQTLSVSQGRCELSSALKQCEESRETESKVYAFIGLQPVHRLHFGYLLSSLQGPQQEWFATELQETLFFKQFGAKAATMPRLWTAMLLAGVKNTFTQPHTDMLPALFYQLQGTKVLIVWELNAKYNQASSKHHRQFRAHVHQLTLKSMVSQ